MIKRGFPFWGKRKIIGPVRYRGNFTCMAARKAQAKRLQRSGVSGHYKFRRVPACPRACAGDPCTSQRLAVFNLQSP